MFDTVAAFCEVRDLPDELFKGGSVVEDFETGRSHARLWLNPGTSSDYAPRYTYWREAGVLKVEASLEKLSGAIRVINGQTMDAALNALDGHIQQHIGRLPSVREWTVQRIDYTWTWYVHPSVAVYIAAMKHHDLSGMSKQDFGATGVVWKQGNRWVKLYDKSVESSIPGEWLRLEVSNYKTAVQYMCAKWFDCERTVDELLHPGRALYVLSMYLQRLGLSHGVTGDIGLMWKLRDTYGSSASSAFYALTLLRLYGSSAHKTGLTSYSTLTQWKKRLLADGFVLRMDGEYVETDQHELAALHLPVQAVFQKLIGENLEMVKIPAPSGSKKNFGEFWGVISDALGVPRGPGSAYLAERFGHWVEDLLNV